MRRPVRHDEHMRYATAVRRLRQIAGDAHRVNWPGEDPVLLAVYTFGPVLDHPDELDWVDVALVLDSPPEELSWGVEPPSASGIIQVLRLDKSPVRRFWRPAVWPVWNHMIREPVRIWSLDGPDEAVLNALERGKPGPPRMPAPFDAERREQTAMELAASLAHLREVRDRYWDSEWRRDHQGYGTYPENHLWNAVWGYLDLSDAARQLGPGG